MTSTSSNYRITISPDPTRIVNKAQKRSYLACMPREQYNILRRGIIEAIEDVRTGFFENDIELEITLYFELNSSGNLHAHGDLSIKYFDNVPMIHSSFLKSSVQRMMMRTLGREFIKGNPKTLLDACCDIQSTPWVELTVGEIRYKSWLQYCLKDQSEEQMKRFPPLRYKTDTIEYLQTALSITEVNTPEYKNIERRINRLNNILRGLEA